MEPRPVYVETQKGPSLRYEITCQFCGNKKLIHPCRLKRGGKYCSRECQNKAQAKAISDETRKTMIQNSLKTKYQRIDEHISQITGKPAATALYELHHTKQMTILGMSKYLKLARSTIETALKRHNIQKRKYDQSSYLREWYKRNPGAGAILAEYAHRAVKGSRRSDEDLIKRALSVQEQAKLSKLEKYVLDYFNNCGLSPVPLYAVYKFNIDLAFPEHKLAVEIHGGNFHTTPRKIKQDKAKEEYLKSIGWDIVVIKQGTLKMNSPGMRQLLSDAVSKVKEKLKSYRPS
jgi:very-short-patch-repair endonuclease